MTPERSLTCVWVFGVYDGDRRADGGVVEHGDLVVAGREAGRVVVHVLDQEEDVGLAGATAAVRRLRHQVELDLLLTVQNGQSEQLAWRERSDESDPGSASQY